MEIFDMIHDTIAKNINAYISVCASLVPMSQKLQIIVVWGIYSVFLMSRLLFVADVTSVWEKPWNIQQIKHAH